MAAPVLSYCGEQVRRHDNDRFICDMLAPPVEREGLFALHAFNLEVARIREQVREPMLGHIRLRWWSDTLEAIYASRAPAHQVAGALGQTIARYRLDRALLDRIIDGRAFDMEDRAPASLADLLIYVDATSASLSLAGLQVLQADAEPARQAAREVGIAWALVGLVRAVPFHARARRIYLPADLNRAAGLDAYKLFDKGPTPGLTEVIEQVVGVAREHLGRARSLRPQVAAAALPVLLPARLADSYLRRLQRAGFDPFDRAIEAPNPWRVARAALGRLRQRY